MKTVKKNKSPLEFFDDLPRKLKLFVLCEFISNGILTNDEDKTIWYIMKHKMFQLYFH